jgi:hypothetical protein
MVGNPFAFGSTLTPTQQAPWGPTSTLTTPAYPFTPQPYPLLQPTLPSGGYGFAPPPTPLQSAQQILQWLQLLPQQLQQLTYLQQQTLQQLLQVLPAQHQQLQQVVQLVPHLIHQLQQHVLAQSSAAGLPYAGFGVGGFGGMAPTQPLQAFPAGTPSNYAAQPSHVM